MHDLLAPWQDYVFETLDHLGPETAAVCAGFAVYCGLELLLTHAGDRYLQRQIERSSSED